MTVVYYRPMKSRSTAIFLALFLGGLGIHKFYLNRPGWGFLYVIFCWTFIPLVVAVIEAILLLCMRNEDFDYDFNGMGQNEEQQQRR